MGITPESIVKPIETLEIFSLDPFELEIEADVEELSPDAKGLFIDQLMTQMREAADALDFERAAYLRDKIEKLGGVKKAGVRRRRRG